MRKDYSKKGTLRNGTLGKIFKKYTYLKKDT